MEAFFPLGTILSFEFYTLYVLYIIYSRKIVNFSTNKNKILKIRWIIFTEINILIMKNTQNMYNVIPCMFFKILCMCAHAHVCTFRHFLKFWEEVLLFILYYLKVL